MEGFLQHLADLEKADGDDSGFGKEFTSMKRCLASVSAQSELSTEAGSARSNVKKNRYKDILPYDQTRVPLTLLLHEGYSDYINANFIRGIGGEKYYIATQGPLGQTVTDLWRMIWEYQVKVVVMACREFELGKRKCERYWATEEEGTVVFGPFTVTHVGEETLRDEVSIRTLSVTLLDDVAVRSVVQFQYTAWPDHGIPKDFDSLLEMIDLMHKHQGALSSPICVHCSAGCGRTGVICAVDYVRSMIQRKLIGEDFAIMDLVKEMRRQRPAAVQTKDQYEFIYRIVAEMFQRELASADPHHQNLDKDGRASGGPDAKQPTSARAAGLSGPQGGAQVSGTMASAGSAGVTYAAVGRRREAGGSRPVSCYTVVPSSGCTYENLSQEPQPPAPSPSSSAYSTVVLGDLPRLPPAKGQYANLQASPSPHGSPSVSYTSVVFGPPASPDEAAEWAPSLPERTAESYIVQEPGEDPGRLTETRNWSSKLLGAFKPAALGGANRTDPSAHPDEGYEDVSGLPPVSSFSSRGLGFNARVSKPRGPRPPPELWALYGQ